MLAEQCGDIPRRSPATVLGYARQAGNIVFLSAGVEVRPQYMCTQMCRQIVGRVVLKRVGRGG